MTSLLILAAALLLSAAAAPPSAVVLLGPSGSGKSETSNTLVGSTRFAVSAGLESETQIPHAEHTIVSGREWQVVDTPGYFDTSRTPEELENALAQFSELVTGKVALLAFVVPYGRFGDAHLRGWRLIRSTFGNSALQHTVLVFTSCGNRTEVEVQEETARLCSKTPPPTLCGVLADLGALLPGSGDGDSGRHGPARIVAFGQLEPSRRERDRSHLLALAAELEQAAGGPGHGYDPRSFSRARAQKKLLAQRIALVADAEERRLLELLLQEVEAGGAGSEEELQRRLQRAEGVSGETHVVRLDFEDRTLGPFQQVGAFRAPEDGWRNPMPLPYHMLPKEFGNSPGGGELLLHTGSDSGVRLRKGERRVGELRSSPFFLGRGEISWEGSGAGGFFAVCKADAVVEGRDEGVVGCLERPFRKPSAGLEPEAFSEEELLSFLGAAVYLRIVDRQKGGWGFLALDNIAYPVLSEPENGTGQEEAPTPPTAEAAAAGLSQSEAAAVAPAAAA